MPAGMTGDRASVIFAVPDELTKMIEISMLRPRLAQKRSSALPRATIARASPGSISFARRRSAFRLIVHAHQAEAARSARTPIVVRSKPDATRSEHAMCAQVAMSVTGQQQKFARSIPLTSTSARHSTFGKVLPCGGPRQCELAARDRSDDPLANWRGIVRC